jgi:hypothetical protein
MIVQTISKKRMKEKKDYDDKKTSENKQDQLNVR